MDDDPAMRKERWRVILIVVLLPVLAFAFLFFERLRGQVSLSRYKRELIAQGEKLDSQDLASVYNESENGAPEVFANLKLLTNGIVCPSRRGPIMARIESGRAIVGFREPEWISCGRTNRWDELELDLRVNEPVLSRIRVALSKPVLDRHLKSLATPYETFTQPGLIYGLAHWFSVASQFALHSDRVEDAVINVISELQLIRLLEKDRRLSNEDVRALIAADARCNTWAALLHNQWTDEQLSRIQEAWEKVSFASSLARSLEGERDCQTAFYDLIRNSREADIKMVSPSAHFPRGMWLWRYAWLDQHERNNLEEMQRFLTVTRNAAKHASYVQANIEFRQFFPNSNFQEKLLPMLFFTEDYRNVESSLKQAMRAESDRSMVICAIALKRYALLHGKFPDTLKALGPDFLSSIPIDYMDGKPIRYRLQRDGSFLLYSVGENGIDDGGDGTFRKHQAIKIKRKDDVWPSPALSDEVEAYRKETAKDLAPRDCAPIPGLIER